MRVDWRTSAGVIAAAIFVVAYSWQPPAEELRPRAAIKTPGLSKPSMFEVPKPPEPPRLPLRPAVVQSSFATPTQSPPRGLKHRLASLWPFRRHSQSH